MDGEIREIVDGCDDGSGLNALVDEFRRGRNVRELVSLLESDDPELVSIGAWIFGELPEDLYCADDLVTRLHSLTEHIDPMVRFHAFGAVYPFLSRSDTATQALLRRLLRDENDGVRMSAEAAASRLSQ